MIAPLATRPAPSVAVSNRVRAAAHLARTVFPGPVGDLLYHELAAWVEYAYRFDARGRGMALAADIEARHAVLAAERAFRR